MVSELFDEGEWKANDRFAFEDITYHTHRDGTTVRIAFDRPEVRNAFRPQTVDELFCCARRRPPAVLRRMRPFDRQRTVAARRWMGVLLGR